jgi:cyclase
MIQVSKNVYVETGMTACNVGFVTTKAGVVMIDTPMRPNDAIKWRDEAARKGKIEYIINTEEHADHWQTSYFFPGVLVTSQETRDKLAKAPKERVMDTVKRIDPDALPLMEKYQVRLADVTFTEKMNLYVGDHTFQLFSLPGHSSGGIGVYIPQERVVFATDIVFHKKKSWLQEADPAAWLASLKKIGGLDADVVVPGHGDICKKEYLEEEAGIIRKWEELVRSAIKQGLSADQAESKIASPDPHPKQQGTPMTEAELHKAIITRLYSLYS